MASADKFDRSHGTGRSRQPSAYGQDALVAAAAIISSLQTYVSRNNDPLNPLVITIGTIRGGSQRNIIAAGLKWKAPSGCILPKGKVYRKRHAENHSRNSGSIGCEAVLSYQYMLPPLYNSPGLSAIAGNAIRKLFRRSYPPGHASGHGK